MKFKELSKKHQKEVFEEIKMHFIENGETEKVAVECAKDVIRDIDEDGRFVLVDYSSDEDESDLRVEY